MTSTLIVHVEKLPTRPPASEIVSPPSGAVTVPSQPLTTLAGDAIAMFGKSESVSLNARPVVGVALSVLSIVNVSVLTLPCPIVSGENALVNPGVSAT